MRKFLEYIKSKEDYIIAAFIIIIIVVIVNMNMESELANRRKKEERINNIETRLIEQEHYMHSVQADIDNLKED